MNHLAIIRLFYYTQGFEANSCQLQTLEISRVPSVADINMEEKETDDWAFRKLGPEAGVPVVERYDEVPQERVNLFDISNGDSETALFAAAGSKAVVVGKAEALYQKLAINSELETRSIPVSNPLFVQILANASQIAVYDQQNELTLFGADGTKQWSSTIEGITQLEKHPSQASLAYICNGNAFLLTDSVTQKLGEAKRLCFDSEGNAVLGTDSSIMFGSSTVNLPKEGVLVYLQSAGSSILAVISEDDEYTAFLYTSGSWVDIPDACPPFGDDSRYLTWYSGAVAKWIGNDLSVLVASASQSSDMLLATSSEILSPSEDADKASMPFTEDETSPVGAATYTGSSLAPPKGFAGVEELAPMPIWMVLTNEGFVTGWAILSREAIKSGATLSTNFSITATLNPQAKLSIENTASELASEEVVDPDLLSGLSVSTGASKAQPTVEQKESAAKEAAAESSEADKKEPEIAATSSVNQSSLFGAVPSSFGSSWGSSSAFGSKQPSSAPKMQFNFSSSSQPVAPSPSFSFGKPDTKESPFGALAGKSVFTSDTSSPFASLQSNRPNALDTNTESPFASVTNNESAKPKSIFNLDSSQKKENENPFGKLKTPETSIFGQSAGGDQKSVFGQPQGEGLKSISCKPEEQKSIFGKPEEQKSIFGKPTEEQKSLFGKPQAEEQKSVFGKPAEEQRSFFDQPTGEKKSIFGKPEEQKSFFGKPEGQKSLFGKPEEQKSIVGKPAREQKSLFGQPTGEQRSLFGNPAEEQKSLFGKPEEQKSLFGEPADEPKSLFGKQPGEEPKSLFGGPSYEQPKSLFGKAAGDPPKSLFGQPSGEQQETVLGKPAGETKSLFGKPEIDAKGLFSEPVSSDKTQASLDLGGLGEALNDMPFPKLTINDSPLPKAEATNADHETQTRPSGIEPVAAPDLDEDSEATESESEVEDGEIDYSLEESFADEDGSDLTGSESVVSLSVSESVPASEPEAIQTSAIEEPLVSVDAEGFSEYEEVLDPNEITYAEFPPEDEELLEFSVPEPVAPLSDLDSAYAETNQLFQVLDYNLQVLENLTARVKNQNQLSGTPDLLDFEKWTLESIPKLASVVTSLSETVKNEQVSDEQLQSAGKLRQGLEESFVDINEVAESLVFMRRDLGSQAQRRRPLPFTAAKLQRHMRDQLETVHTKLKQCEASILNLKAKQNPPRVADINVAMDVVEAQVNKLSNVVGSLGSRQKQSLGAADISAYSASILGLSEMKEYDEVFVDQQRQRKFIEKVGASLRNRTL
ncbi:Nucleoporin AMO1 [Wickerhamiella sorbophila]|uniref:Nucleoporin AMO1 n=1 Tax=Wickerhamiella sorbophila TaxID=45607 RepID=A0A2T0FJT5_9ASCO|nr:Nucleoporin AMO1 [Wickerhamiella sorbophila]PRT55239.1 Nucleoporin AMO1 [Wickerhamiella sorbophila]